jgi:hypothetical protein
MKKQLIFWLAAVTLIFFACQKELSFEGSNSPAKGSLKADVSGDCLPKTINGTYTVGVALVPATNTITVQVNITKTGTFVVTTDTVNGFYFRGTGTFTTLGLNTISLRGNGTPFANIPTNFVVSFDGTVCDIQVPVTAPGAGFLVGSPNACAPIIVSGNYSPGTTMGAGNIATVQVNVTTAGLINITTDTVAGIWFNFSGSMALGNNQNVTLTAHNTIPAGTTTGLKQFKVKLGTSQCTFDVNVAAPASGTVNCSGAAPVGSYNATVVLDPVTNTVQISVNVTTAGAYNITTDTVDTPTNGIWFDASGTFPTAPATVNVTLAGHGTPAAAGTFQLTVKFGTSTCTFSCTVAPPINTDHFPLTANSWWSYDDVDGIIVTAGDSLYRLNINPITLAGNTYRIFQNHDNTTLTDSSYFRRNGNDYFERTFADYYTGVISFDANVMGDINFLKEGLTTGATWESSVFSGTVSGLPVKLKYAFSCTNASATATINGNNFSNVYKVSWRPKVSVDGGITYTDEAIILESWYARGVGLIYFNVTDLAGGPIGANNIMHWQVF